MKLNELIPIELSQAVLKHTKVEERKEVAGKSNITTNVMLNAVVYRKKDLTEKHLPAFTELIKVAIKNASSATADVELLQSVIKNS